LLLRKENEGGEESFWEKKRPLTIISRSTRRCGDGTQGKKGPEREEKEEDLKGEK